MKKIIFVFLFVFATQLYCQIYGPEQYTIETYTDSTYTTKDFILISPNSTRFELLNKNAIGFHWGSGRAMADGIGVKTTHTESYDHYKDSSQMAPYSDLIVSIV